MRLSAVETLLAGQAASAVRTTLQTRLQASLPLLLTPFYAAPQLPPSLLLGPARRCFDALPVQSNGGDDAAGGSVLEVQVLEAQGLPHSRDIGTSSSLFVRLSLGEQVAGWAAASCL